MKRILLCTGEEKNFDKMMTMFELNSTESKLEHVAMFKHNSLIHRILRNLGSLFTKIEINDVFKKNLQEYDALIIFESVVKNHFISYIRKRNPNLRIIIYFRNQFSDSKKRNISLKILKKLNVEFWSYNRQDCLNLNFKYNNQFWNTEYYSMIEEPSFKYDCVFCGKTKNRISSILELYNLCSLYGLNDYIYLVPKSDYDFDRNTENKYMDYLEYLNKIMQSKAIVDLVCADNYGLTIRPLEAQFLQKKLITNYSEIKEYDFYDKENIFILGEDDPEEFIEFINTDFKKIDDEVLKKYDFKNWLGKFFD